MESSSRASEASRKIFHLSADLPGLISCVATCRLTRASVAGRRPKGVVTCPPCIFLHPLRGKKNPLTKKTVPKTLDWNSGKCDSLVVTPRERLPRRQRLGGLFLLRCFLSWIDPKP